MTYLLEYSVSRYGALLHPSFLSSIYIMDLKRFFPRFFKIEVAIPKPARPPRMTRMVFARSYRMRQRGLHTTGLSAEIFNILAAGWSV